MMDIQQLKYFIAVCESMNYTKASEQLFVSRQAVSKAIKQLEQELGAKLILSNNNQTMLTPLGQKVYNDAKPLVEDFIRFSNNVHGYITNQKGRLKVLFGAAILTNFPSDCFIKFNSIYSDIMLSITEADNSEMRAMLDSHKADVCLVGTSSDYIVNHRYTLLKPQKLCILVNKNNPLSTKEFLTIDDLKGQAIVGHGEEYDLHNIYTAACAEAGFEPKFSIISTDINIILQLLRQNKTICFGTETPDMQSSDLSQYAVSIPLKLPGIKDNWGIYAVTAKDRPLSDIQKLFISYLKSQI